MFLVLQASHSFFTRLIGFSCIFVFLFHQLLFDILPDMPVLNGLCDQRPAKLSIRRELRKKCRQDYLPSQRILKNNYFLKKQMISGSLHADHLRETDQAGMT